VEEDKLNHWGCVEERSNLIGCHLFNNNLLEKKAPVDASFCLFHRFISLCLFFVPSLFIFLFNLPHPRSDKLSQYIHDTSTDDKVCECACADIDMP